MAKKSKTQKAKASAARAKKREQEVEVVAEETSVEISEAEEQKPKKASASADKAEKKTDIKKSDSKKTEKSEKKTEKPKKKRFQFLRDIKAELGRVTWPTKQEVLRWSMVVLGALIFFGVFVAVLDNFIVTPFLLAISGLGA